MEKVIFNWKIINNNSNIFFLVLKSNHASKLLTFHKKAKRALKWIRLQVYAQVYFYWFVNLWLKQSFTFRDIILHLYIPFYSLYSSNGKVFSFITIVPFR